MKKRINSYNEIILNRVYKDVHISIKKTVSSMVWERVIIVIEVVSGDIIWDSVWYPIRCSVYDSLRTTK